ncbi:MAG: D-glycero-beta-D-manno-heptose 1,7-bisphosphate 7-phosphatase [Gammaproteobacteria bacterium]|nr:D-glycero-beta-D-manno-heptose 1,7-bisphosphate 7-phosphatase [Gammaproteobacteria bacterium]MDH5241263.1 D-glycero-beta-D-manno-heptose 1,7-bisphosphate 7-phosphatase [Gammaproteobacteria bacterium]MDH5263024.1 D-glycero-beta-D-manno-heptose 1,7-bisphosphate 7-phosphatase [Gammaproteobacteria bacterium]MDH5622795.1 D-glycero-beta-D-manno-heptose 1,7-bisphosphate 7-phosphatase [Gammaproteobacteria bacterium]
MSERGLLILDRDGVINRESREFVKSADEWLPLPGSIGAIAALSNAGYTVTVASNQSGLARGLFDAAALQSMHDKLHGLVAAKGGHIDRIVFCPHGPDDNCDCRKPKPGLLLQLSEHYGVALTGVPVIGDSLRDLEAAVAAGARPILVRTGNGRETEAALVGALAGIEVFDDLAAAAKALV